MSTGIMVLAVSGIFGKMQEFIKEFLMGWVMSNLEKMFGDVNTQTTTIAQQVGKTPEVWNNQVFTFIKQLSTSAVLPIAGIIIAYVLAHNIYEITMKKNSMQTITYNQINTWLFVTCISVYMVIHAFDLVMSIFSIGQWMVIKTNGVIGTEAKIDVAKSVQTIFEKNYDAMTTGQLFGLGIETMLLSFGMKIISVIITVILYGRMIHIYIYSASAAIPVATICDQKLEGIGYNYVQTICALALQGFLIMLCVGIYCVLIKSLTVTDDISSTLWNVMAYTVLLCYSLLKTETWAKSILSAR